MFRPLIRVGLIVMFLGLAISPIHAQTAARPFSLPFNTPPGPATWLVGQQYGNTTGAANFGKYWYAAGQGLHFGIDFPAPCGTAVVAIADGIVEAIDNFAFGLQPHNVVLSHQVLGYTSLYGHLYTRADLVKGQGVRQGEVIGLSGDPDVTCVSRPHLHLEIRSMDYRTAYNPALLIDADWAMLSSMGSYSAGMFAKDLTAPNRWQTMEDQPLTRFGGSILNAFKSGWPLPQRVAPPSETLPAFSAPPISQPVTARQITSPGCCSDAWWSPDGQSMRFWDGPDGQRAVTRIVSVAEGTPEQQDTGFYRLFSPDGQYQIQWEPSQSSLVVRGPNGAIYPIKSDGAWPRFSPGSSRLLWQHLYGDVVPGSSVPRGEIWVSNVDGSGRTLIATMQGSSVHWLDDNRILISQRVPATNVYKLSITSLADRSNVPLITATNLRSLTVAPGGGHVVYYLPYQTDASASGIYLLETRSGATPQKLPFFGGWNWRDSSTLLFIPFRPGQAMTLHAYDITSGADTDIAGANAGFQVANGDWSVSPDGRFVAYWKADQYAIWLLRLS